MALIPVVGRKSPHIRLAIAALYVILTLGAATMVYPFLMMIGGSITSGYDQGEDRVAPRYLTQDSALFAKYAEDKYDGDIDKINDAYRTHFAKLQDVAPPRAPTDPQVLREWTVFVSTLPMRYKTAGFAGSSAAYSPSPLLDLYRDYLRQKFHGDIQALDRAYTQEDESFLTVFPPFEQPAKRTWSPDRTAKGRDWAAFEQTLPSSFFVVDAADPIYESWLKQEQGYSDLSALNAGWGTNYTDYSDIPLAAAPTGNAAQRQDWETFVRTKLPFRYVHLSPAAGPAYAAALRARYKNDYAAYTHAYGPLAASAAAFAGSAEMPIPNPDSIPATGPPLLDWLDFIKISPLADVSVDSAETRYRAFAAANGIGVGGGPAVMPIYAADSAAMRADRASLRWDYIARNYRLVLQFIVLHGTAVLNTVVYCLLAIAAALIVNPLCAYALSRYNLPWASGVLLFLLSTMAFPAEVSMIPNFLLLKNLGLLNTFAALILPGVASGYSIFILKGFFDSLPKELYEAGTIDGASEMRMFWQITLPLSRPIFAVIGLGAFTAAYGAFLFAAVTCPDQRMWTLTVWLYELQTAGAPASVTLAALTLAAIPTLLVFMLAQKTIMKGIIIPSYK